MAPIGPGVITAVARLLALVARVGPERKDVLIALASRTSLRAGALPFKTAGELGERLRLIEERDDGTLRLTAKGKELLPLLADDPEPNETFREMVASLALTVAPVRVLGGALEVRPDGVAVQRAGGDILLLWLEGVGLAKRQGDCWTLVGLGKILAAGPLAIAEDPPDLRAEVGALGETLSLRYEAERLGGKGTAIQVSNISAAFGFDILSRSGNAVGAEPSISRRTAPFRSGTTLFFPLLENCRVTCKVSNRSRLGLGGGGRKYGGFSRVVSYM